ncbi:MAG: pseudouridine synthase [Deltaproteobacteria bacterium]
MDERLQKIISSAGITSRRKAEDLIVQGRVSVNRKVVSKLGATANTDTDEIRVDDKIIKVTTKHIYIALNKPAGYITSLADTHGRKTVKELIANIPQRIFPVGRLDYDSEGLLLMTNDGDFALHATHPRFNIEKHYTVKVKGNIDDQVIKRLERGVILDDGAFKARTITIEKRNAKSTWVSLRITEGRNRIIRRVFETVGCSVIRLIRIAVGNVKLGQLANGSYRHLSSEEIHSFRVLEKP